MKAIQVFEPGAPEVMRLEEIPTPMPEAGQVLVRVHAIGVNPVDTYIRSGKYARMPAMPYTPGTDASGVVKAIGSDVTTCAVGDRVYTSGTLSGAYSDHTLCAANQVHALPQRVSFEQGAGINIPYATAYRALVSKARAVPGETTLIHGASGGVGIAAVQISRALGLRILGTAGSDRGLALVKEQGAHEVFDHRTANYPESVIKLTDGIGMNVIIEMLANVNLARDLTLLARNGRIVIVGSRGPIEINPREAMAREATIMGMMLFNGSENELVSIHAALAAGLENGTLRPIVGKTFPLTEAAQAHHAVMEPGAHGKVVLVP